MWLVVTILESTNTEHFHHHRKFYWIVLAVKLLKLGHILGTLMRSWRNLVQRIKITYTHFSLTVLDLISTKTQNWRVCSIKKKKKIKLLYSVRFWSTFVINLFSWIFTECQPHKPGLVVEALIWTWKSHFFCHIKPSIKHAPKNQCITYKTYILLLYSIYTHTCIHMIYIHIVICNKNADRAIWIQRQLILLGQVRHSQF